MRGISDLQSSLDAGNTARGLSYKHISDIQIWLYPVISTCNSKFHGQRSSSTSDLRVFAGILQLGVYYEALPRYYTLTTIPGYHRDNLGA